MDVILLIAQFSVLSLALNFLSAKKIKLAAMCNIIALCLVIGTAYQFELIEKIIVICIIVAVIMFAIRYYLDYKKKEKKDE